MTATLACCGRTTACYLCAAEAEVFVQLAARPPHRRTLARAWAVAWILRRITR